MRMPRPLRAAILHSPSSVGPVGPSFDSLTLSSTQIPVNQPWATTVNKQTAGSTVTATSSDGTPLTISGGVVSGAFSGTGTPSITLTETGLGYPDKNTVIPVNVYTPTPISLGTFATINGFGDSITVGLAATTPSTGGWLALVGSAVSATVTNNGASGTILQNSYLSGAFSQSLNGRDRWNLLIGPGKKAAVFVAYGYNDARYVAGGSVNVANYVHDYREILNGLFIGGYTASTIHMVSPYYIIDAGLTSGSGGFSGQTRSGFEKFVSAAEQVATEYGVRYTPAYSYLRDNGYSSTIDTDNIHPLDAGHAIIRTAVTTQTFVPNSSPAPTTVAATVAGSAITASCDAVTGGASYDFELINNPVAAASANDATTSHAFTGVVPGAYYIKARAVFADGTKGPWGFSASSYTVAAAAGVFATDTFVGTSGTPINKHTPDTGNIWVSEFGYGTTPSRALNGTGGTYSGSTTDIYRNTTAPSGADYWVQADFIWKSTIAGDQPGIAGRMQPGAQTYYFVRWSQTAGGWQLFRCVNASNVQIGTTSTDTFTGGTKTIRLTMVGTTISVQLNGSTIITVTDANITAAGFAGMRTAVAQSATTGIHIGNFIASS